MEHPLDSGVHFFFFDKLTSLGGSNPPFHGFKETGFVLQITGERVLHELAGFAPLLGGKMSKLSLQFWGNVHFHTSSVRSGKRDVNQRSATNRRLVQAA